MNKKKEADFASEMAINRYKLDEECEKQPSLYHFYSLQLAEKRAERDQQKAIVKLKESRKNLYYRENPVGGSKATEKMIASMVESDEDLIRAKDKLRMIEKDLYTLEAAESALDSRRKMLSDLVQLFIKSYFGKPEEKRSSIPNDQASSEIKKKMNKDREGK